MRVLKVALMSAVFSCLAFGQAGVRGVPAYCPYGCGPYIPLVTTPGITFVTVSGAPVGARNATGGLEAGARNSTLAMVPGNTDAVHTEAVWYRGGDSPLISPSIRLPHPEFPGMHEEHGEHMMHGHEEGPNASWTYYSGRLALANPVEASAAAKTGKRANRTYTNDDVARVAAINQPFRRK